MKVGRFQGLYKGALPDIRAIQILVTCVLAVGCRPSGLDDRGEHERVVVYTSVDRVFSEPVLQEAEKRLGIRVVGVYDTEETKSTGLVNRLIARKDNPDGDIFWSGDPGRAAFLKLKGLTTPYDSTAASGIPSYFGDPEHHWTGFSARARVLLVNNNLVSHGTEPKSLFDLTKPEWSGKVAMANPLFGTTSFHIAALFESLGDKAAREWLAGLKSNKVQLVASNGEVKRQVSYGQAAVGLADTDDAAEAIGDGQPVRAVFLDQSEPTAKSLGTLVIPNTLSLINGGPNPEGARKIFDFLLSVDVQKMLAQSCAQAPLTSGVETPTNVLSLEEVVPMLVDYRAVAERLEALLPELKAWVDSP
ncbi:MAG: extracellular solute-binding protein [Candidatus Hydrogenedentes bacterium]|nr:extracellular solute-binding protein [Candidatus Hydrogenedentota bacterium]